MVKPSVKGWDLRAVIGRHGAVNLDGTSGKLLGLGLSSDENVSAWEIATQIFLNDSSIGYIPHVIKHWAQPAFKRARPEGSKQVGCSNSETHRNSVTNFHAESAIFTCQTANRVLVWFGLDLPLEQNTSFAGFYSFHTKAKATTSPTKRQPLLSH